MSRSVSISVIDEPLLEFGYSGTHQEQRAGIVLHGPADVQMEERLDRIRIGVVGTPSAVTEVQDYLRKAARGAEPRRFDMPQLFPDFPGCDPTSGYRARLSFSKATQAELERRDLRAITQPEAIGDRIRAGVDVCAAAIRRAVASGPVDVVVLARPPGVPDGSDDADPVVGANFHDLLKAAVIDVGTPVQIVRPATWRGGMNVEDDATRAWNLFTALFYKAGGKPWRLHQPRTQPTRLFIGVSFTKLAASNDLFASVAQVFNELGEGVIVRGGTARKGEHDRQPHLPSTGAEALLTDALERYRQVHGTLPAALTVHKTSAFSTDETRGFELAAEAARVRAELIWVTSSDDVIVLRGAKPYPALRGTLVTLDDREHVLYTHGSVPYYRTYPGQYVPRPLGLRPHLVERSITEVAEEVLALTKLNWNRPRMDGRWPITLLTARRVGEILRHVPSDTPPAPSYAFYM